MYEKTTKQDSSLNSKKKSNRSRYKLKKDQHNNPVPEPGLEIDLKDSSTLFDTRIDYPENFPHLSRMLKNFSLDEFDFFRLQ